MSPTKMKVEPEDSSLHGHCRPNTTLTSLTFIRFTDPHIKQWNKLQCDITFRGEVDVGNLLRFDCLQSVITIAFTNLMMLKMMVRRPILQSEQGGWWGCRRRDKMGKEASLQVLRQDLLRYAVLEGDLTCSQHTTHHAALAIYFRLITCIIGQQWVYGLTFCLQKVKLLMSHAMKIYRRKSC